MSEITSDRSDAFLRLLTEHDRAIYTYILALTHHWADAEDIMQETRLRLWQQFDKYKLDTDFGAWARSIAYYLVLAAREKASRSRVRFGSKFYEAVQSAEQKITPDLLIERENALLRCIKMLNDAKRSLIEAYYVSRQSLREFARQVGQSYESVRKTIYRTQIILAECIERELQDKRGDE